MKRNWRNLTATILTVILGCVLFYVGTDGFRAYTAESARTYKLLKEKPEFPNVTLEDSKGRVYSFSELKGKNIMLTFIYTACSDVCPKLEMNLAEVYQQIPATYIGKDLLFLSISFDPARDDVETLEKYRKAFGSDGDTWRMARIADQNELNELLEEFGVIVIPDGEGGFTHNSAFYLVNKKGYLEEVMDFTKIDEAVNTVINLLENEVEE
ncbi:protein SCO1/2 [Cytobacillus eiseniae]|uniref:Protein SCO1/2 n=1 Tax=Cytobacillus eiseniae TaxID=762947 RepID=A0ABS4RHN2_9BACI|nr:SCO family protein [Cytobacillus eiseniae]MBP2241931.1 protein SCO1/2 [Cytobacillus eiseniae]